MIVRAVTELEGKRWTTRKSRGIVRREEGMDWNTNEWGDQRLRGTESYKSREMNERHRE